MTQSEAGRCRPSYRTTHLVPADAFTVLAEADHQAAQLSTGISIRLRLSRAHGTIYKANRIGFSPYGRQRAIVVRESNVNRAKRCSGASNGILIHSLMVTVILNS